MNNLLFGHLSSNNDLAYAILAMKVAMSRADMNPYLLERLSDMHPYIKDIFNEVMSNIPNIQSGVDITNLMNKAFLDLEMGDYSNVGGKFRIGLNEDGLVGISVDYHILILEVPITFKSTRIDSLNWNSSIIDLKKALSENKIPFETIEIFNRNRVFSDNEHIYNIGASNCYNGAFRFEMPFIKEPADL